MQILLQTHWMGRYLPFLIYSFLITYRPIVCSLKIRIPFSIFMAFILSANAE